MPSDNLDSSALEKIVGTSETEQHQGEEENTTDDEKNLEALERRSNWQEWSTRL